MAGLNEEVKAAWDLLEREDKQRYINLAKTKTSRRDNASLFKLALKLFREVYEVETERSEYQDGAEGLIKWAEKNVRVKIKKNNETVWTLLGELPDDEDEYGRSSRKMWEKQKGEIRIALEVDEKGKFKRNLVVFCWPRGEGKSFIVILIVMWGFFNFPFFKAKLAANSKDQSDFVHFGEIREVIENSPALYEIVGEKGIIDKEIRITKGKKGKFNSITILSTGSGLASNVNMVTQSEAFEMPDNKFFVKWYGSLRNTPNAIGLIDTTVSGKDHWLYEQLYTGYLKNPDGVVYFSYRSNKGADPSGYWNPGMTKRQIDGYRDVFTAVDFARFFENLFDTQDIKLLSEEDIQAMRYIGVDGIVGGENSIREILIRHNKLKSQEDYMSKRFSQYTNAGYHEANKDRFGELERLMPIESVFDLGNHIPADSVTSIRGTSIKSVLADLNKLGKLYNTHWAILAGIDKSDPMKYTNRTEARTSVVWLAKGLPDSIWKSKFELNKVDLLYIYVLLGVAIVENSMDYGVQMVLKHVLNTFGSIDMVTGEMYGMAGIRQWCEQQNNIEFQAWGSSLERQRIGYTELLTTITTGRFKAPEIPIMGSRQKDILREELSFLDVDTSGRVPKYGSVEKLKKGGVQDDVVDGITWGMYGGLDITAAQFKPRNAISSFHGILVPGLDLLQSKLSGFYS